MNAQRESFEKQVAAVQDQMRADNNDGEKKW